MKKYIEIIFVTAVIVAGCDTENIASQRLTSEKYLAEEITPTDLSSNALSDVYGGPTSPVRVTIDEIKNKENETISTLTISATNTCEVDLIVRAKISAVGLLAFSEEIVLSQKTLKAGKTQTWAFPVKNLPFESASVISQIEASVQYKETNEKEFTGTFSSEHYYYLSGENEDEIKIFNEEYFLREHKGKLRPLGYDVKKTSYLGKIKKSDGTVEEITSESIGMQILDDEGYVVGTVLDEQEYDPRYTDEEAEL
ncbi:MAG: hypothetical protein JXX29_08835 [Deltaproteobacteria bacterium]|nr:hypothetical protein [Deltaproteobacteria bacterium]MBN2671766.1 hypothetical protein [Deltaproteobacteria bacterium]